ncbi:MULTISPECIES: hypothetical protein [unclassified Streptomyces]|uniref:hypothetical protein n=1 Tax=unclassified Streptomyces TaxID=2593676 RepID=UPI00190DE91C|nr:MULTISPECIES: hypothetical protein [unclassified Streptomyces]MBK3563133.1 hypothetical protein [Streptomyces sp. MBT62]MBK6012227.1 hypothetical protein [Streptomyces sp. MBT53]
MATAWGRGHAETGEWLEVYGETEPRSVPLERILATDTDEAHPFTAYLYVWTLGYSREARRTEVTLLFPAEGDWRVKDLQAVVYHLPPVQEERAWRDTLARDLQVAGPILEAITAGLTGSPTFPDLNAVASIAAHLNARSAPQIQNDEWYVRRVHDTVDETLYQGVEWILPPSFVNQIGTRVTGALLVQFIGAAHGAPEDTPAPPLLARATLTHGKESTALPGGPATDPYVRLPLHVTPEEPLP